MKSAALLTLALCAAPALASAAEPVKAPAPVAPASVVAPAAPASVAAPAAPASAAAPDMSKFGPWSRKPTDEKATKKEIVEFFKQQEELKKKGDFDTFFSQVDYPVQLITDDAKGNPESKAYSKEEYVAMMKPMLQGMPKDTKMTHKPTIIVLSDSLAVVSDDFTMGEGKKKMSGKNGAILVKAGGGWKWKSMVEAGWGGMGGGK